MKTELDTLIEATFISEGNIEDANKVYAAMLRTYLFMPIDKMDKTKLQDNPNEEPFTPLFVKENDSYYVLVFDTYERLQEWAGEHLDKMNFVQILGRDLIRGVADKVHVCLNYGTEFYKEFVPEEITRMKITVGKLDQWGKQGK